MNPDNLRWELLSFNEMGVERLYEVLRARSEVFVVEQRCAFQDLDLADRVCHHLMGWNGDDLAASCRIVPPGEKFPEPSLGRVMIRYAYRGSGLGGTLMRLGIDHLGQLYPSHGIRISAQSYLERFYTRLGFRPVSKPYDEDGIPHIEMLRDAV